MGNQEISPDVTSPDLCKQDAVYSALRAQISHQVAAEIGRDELIQRINLQNLRNREKLCLVLDLDQTLLHTKPLHKLSPEEITGLCNSTRKKDLRRWKAMGVEYLTKLRPYVRKFLREASKLFHMYVYTNGSRDYARIMVGFLDPHGVYFGSRVLSKEDSTVKGQKGLDVVHVNKSGVLILDDTENVWARDRSNLVLIKPYDYFAPKEPDGTRSLSEEGMDESGSAGPLSCALWLLKGMQKSYFENYYKVEEELRGTLLEDNGIHEEKLQEVMKESYSWDLGSSKRLRVSDECSSLDFTKRQRC
ncbi:RNA polymerase II C-terminal domain phosphatase-like 4 [Daucus carota subsp. sativus]|uniref:RNA polymerase II C-terminal domain phosphatase-like 4 n=1 Tax=Daucus carota subsp. sativus TaxID=79200 RepID=UPI0030836DDD